LQVTSLKPIVQKWCFKPWLHIGCCNDGLFVSQFNSNQALKSTTNTKMLILQKSEADTLKKAEMLLMPKVQTAILF
jgi:hypothetical protein